MKNGILQTIFYRKKCKFAVMNCYVSLFMDFLTREGVAEAVYFYCGCPIMAKLDGDEPRDWLLDLFLFEKTKEGFSFWLNIQNRWLDRLEEYERTEK